MSHRPPPISPRHAAGLVLLGLVIATYGSVLGLGGGFIAVPVLHYLYKRPLKESVATSLGLVAATTSAGTLAEVLRPDSRLVWSLVALLVAGSLIGAQIGFWLAQRTRTYWIKLAFAVLLMWSGVEFLVGNGLRGGTVSPDADLVQGAQYGILAHLIALGIGITAGTVSPMLGIAGGLIAVPALYIAVPGLGYLGARACALAMGMVASLRSLMLYRSQHQVHVGRALALASGGVFGGVLGDVVVKIEGFESTAKVLMGITLVVLAARFTWDVLGGQEGRRWRRALKGVRAQQALAERRAAATPGSEREERSQV